MAERESEEMKETHWLIGVHLFSSNVIIKLLLLSISVPREEKMTNG